MQGEFIEKYVYLYNEVHPVSKYFHLIQNRSKIAKETFAKMFNICGQHKSMKWQIRKIYI